MPRPIAVSVAERAGGAVTADLALSYFTAGAVIAVFVLVGVAASARAAVMA